MRALDKEVQCYTAHDGLADVQNGSLHSSQCFAPISPQNYYHAEAAALLFPSSFSRYWLIRIKK